MASAGRRQRQTLGYRKSSPRRQGPDRVAPARPLITSAFAVPVSDSPLVEPVIFAIVATPLSQRGKPFATNKVDRPMPRRLHYPPSDAAYGQPQRGTHRSHYTDFRTDASDHSRQDRNLNVRVTFRTVVCCNFDTVWSLSAADTVAIRANPIIARSLAAGKHHFSAAVKKYGSKSSLTAVKTSVQLSARAAKTCGNEAATGCCARRRGNANPPGTGAGPPRLAVLTHGP